MDGGEGEHTAGVRPDRAGLQPAMLGAERCEREDQSFAAATGEEREDSRHYSGDLSEGEGRLQT